MISRSGLRTSSSVRDGHAVPELIRLHPLDDLGLLADRIEVHLECRKPIEQLDLQVGDVCADFRSTAFCMRAISRSSA